MVAGFIVLKFGVVGVIWISYYLVFGLRGGVVVVGDFCFVLWSGGCGMVWDALSSFVLC